MVGKVVKRQLVERETREESCGSFSWHSWRSTDHSTFSGASELSWAMARDCRSRGMSRRRSSRSGGMDPGLACDHAASFLPRSLQQQRKLHPLPLAKRPGVLTFAAKDATTEERCPSPQQMLRGRFLRRHPRLLSSRLSPFLLFPQHLPSLLPPSSPPSSSPSRPSCSPPHLQRRASSRYPTSPPLPPPTLRARATAKLPAACLSRLTAATRPLRSQRPQRRSFTLQRPSSQRRTLRTTAGFNTTSVSPASLSVTSGRVGGAWQEC